jgi:FtsP/CotA-like multicopper oxidase with cupredoxin domain
VLVTRFRLPLGVFAIALLLAGIAGCSAAGPAPTGVIVPGASASPREVNIIARDYTFTPDTVDFVPGETVLLHVINGGLEVHEAVIGDGAVQDAWEAADAATAGRPPGPTPVVSVPPGVAGIRVVVKSGERVDLTWTVPADAATAGRPWVVGCHIPGHWERGMQVPVRWVGSGSSSVSSGSPPTSGVPAS